MEQQDLSGIEGFPQRGGWTVLLELRLRALQLQCILELCLYRHTPRSEKQGECQQRRQWILNPTGSHPHALNPLRDAET